MSSITGIKYREQVKYNVILHSEYTGTTKNLYFFRLFVPRAALARVTPLLPRRPRAAEVDGVSSKS